MTGPLAKADALLAARLAPWLELSAPKAPAGAEQAQPVLKSPRADNEVLLPTRAGLHPQVGAEPRNAWPGAGAQTSSASTALSAAARAILEIQSDMHAGQSGPVRGSVALWPVARQAPASGALASALSQQVSESGLFYESHLVQFSTGARSLAQMQREPQARLALAADAKGNEPQTPVQQRQPSNVLSAVSAQAPALALPAAATPTLVALMPVASLRPEVQQVTGASKHDASPPPHQQTEALSGRPEQNMPVRSTEYALSRFAQAASAAQPETSLLLDRPAIQASAPEAPTAVAVIHPQAAPLVHQQLDVLASAMFRWSGEAWPGVPMEWSVQEEGARQHAQESADSEPHWSTTVSLDLPRLGSLKVQLKLKGSSVQAQLVATKAQAVDQLHTKREALTHRMSSAGLQLQSLQLDSERVAS